MADHTLPEDRAYTSEHIWLLEDENGFTMGISDYAQAQMCIRDRYKSSPVTPTG